MIRAVYDSLDIGPLSGSYPLQSMVCANSMMFTTERDIRLFSMMKNNRMKDEASSSSRSTCVSIDIDALTSRVVEAIRNQTKQDGLLRYTTNECLEMAADVKAAKEHADSIKPSVITRPPLQQRDVEAKESSVHTTTAEVQTTTRKRQVPSTPDCNESLPKRNPFVTAKVCRMYLSAPPSTVY
jgi:hypothetical protein